MKFIFKFVFFLSLMSNNLFSMLQENPTFFLYGPLDGDISKEAYLKSKKRIKSLYASIKEKQIEELLTWPCSKNKNAIVPYNKIKQVYVLCRRGENPYLIELRDIILNKFIEGGKKIDFIVLGRAIDFFEYVYCYFYQKKIDCIGRVIILDGEKNLFRKNKFEFNRLDEFKNLFYPRKMVTAKSLYRRIYRNLNRNSEKIIPNINPKKTFFLFNLKVKNNNIALYQDEFELLKLLSTYEDEEEPSCSCFNHKQNEIKRNVSDITSLIDIVTNNM